MSSSDISLHWSGEGLVFHGGPDGGPRIVVDGDSEAGPSPMRLLLLSLAGCMAIDVRMILEKSRVPLESLEVVISGERAEKPPRRFTAITLTYRVAGPGPGDEDKLQRAIDLSRDTYCSVLHTLRTDIDLDIRIERI